MAFSIKTKQSVEINGVAYTPVITTELRMRLGSEMDFTTEENSKKAYEILAECFGDKKDEVKELLPKITSFDLQLMRAYLLGGDRLVETVQNELIRNLINIGGNYE